MTTPTPAPTAPPVAAPVAPPAPVVAPQTDAPQPAAVPEKSVVQSMLGNEITSIESRFKSVDPKPVVPVAQSPATEPPAAPADVPAEAQPSAENALAGLSAEQLIEHFKAEHPDSHPSVWKRLADREVTYQTQQAKIKELEEANSKLGRMAQEKKAPAAMTEFEKSLQVPEPAPAQPVAAAPAPPVTPAAPQEPIPDAVGLIIQEWRGDPTEAAPAEAQAWTDYQNATTVQEQRAAQQKIIQIREAQARIMNAPLVDYIQKQVSQALDAFRQQIGQTIAPAQEIAQQRMLEANHEFAVSELERNGLSDIRSLFVPDGQEPIEVKGQLFAPTPLNRIAASNRWLNQIHVTHDEEGHELSPEKAHKATLFARYRAAYSVFRPESQSPASPQPSPQPVAPAPSAPLTPEAAALIEQGRQQAQRELVNDRTRQGVNAGSTATGIGNGGSPSLVQTLLSGAGTTSISSRFKR